MLAVGIKLHGVNPAPMSAALGIISFTWRWNDYLWPLIVVNNQDKFTLQLSLANLVVTALLILVAHS